MRKFIYWLLLPCICYGAAGTLIEGCWRFAAVCALILLGSKIQDHGADLTWRD